MSSLFYLFRVDSAATHYATGYVHGAVTPVGLATNVPVIVSDAVAALHPDDAIWLGGGEPDLKMCLHPQDLIAATDAFVVDCTY